MSASAALVALAEDQESARVLRNEQGLLGGLLIDQAALDASVLTLHRRDFLDPLNGAIFVAIITAKKPVTPESVHDQLLAAGVNQVEIDHLEGLKRQGLGPSTTRKYAKLVRESSEARAKNCDGPVLVQGSTIAPTNIEWLWPGWLALGKLHILAGAPGEGKTTIAMKVAAAVTSGDKFPDGSRCQSGNVLIWSGEDDPADTLIPRLIAAGADVTKVYFVTVTRVAGKNEVFDPARDLPLLVAKAQRVGQVRLVILDPVVSMVTGDSHNNAETRRALQPVVDLAACLGAAVLGISHLSKGSVGRDPTERVIGSIAFAAVARVVMLAARVKGGQGEESKRILVRSKSNIGPDGGGFEYSLEQNDSQPIPASVVTWGAPLDGSARNLLAQAEGGAATPTSATDDATDALRAMLQAGELLGRDAKDAMEREGHTEKVVRRARGRLGVAIRRSGSGTEAVTHWRLPDCCRRPKTEPLMRTVPI